MTPSFAYRALDESDNLLWVSKNPSIVRPNSPNFKRKGSFDSFCDMIKTSSPGIELVLQKNAENEEESKEQFFQSVEFGSKENGLKEEENFDIERSPSMLLDIGDNIYRKGKVNIFFLHFPYKFYASQYFIQTRTSTFFKMPF